MPRFKIGDKVRCVVDRVGQHTYHRCDYIRQGDIYVVLDTSNGRNGQLISVNCENTRVHYKAERFELVQEETTPTFVIGKDYLKGTRMHRFTFMGLVEPDSTQGVFKYRVTRGGAEKHYASVMSLDKMKPAPEMQILYGRVDEFDEDDCDRTIWTKEKWHADNLKLTLEDGKLVKAEVI